MALQNEDKKKYQREYMRRKRSNITGLTEEGSNSNGSNIGDEPEMTFANALEYYTISPGAMAKIASRYPNFPNLTVSRQKEYIRLWKSTIFTPNIMKDSSLVQKLGLDI